MTLPNCLRCGQPRTPDQLGAKGWCERCRAEPPHCRIKGCTKQIKCRRMCDTHYRRWLRNPTWPIDREPANRVRCSAPGGCDRFARALGLCNSHYKQQQRGAELGPLKPARGGVRRGFKASELAEEVEMLIGSVSAENITARLRYADVDSLATTLARSGRPDLSRKLRDSREVAA